MKSFKQGKKIAILFGILFAISMKEGKGQNTWVKKANFGGNARYHAVSFAIDGKGYIGMGRNLKRYHSDFWEYSPSSDVWMQIADFAGAAKIGAVGFSIGMKGYVGTGFDSLEETKDFWEYDPASNIWTQKADFGGDERSYAAGFSIGDKGYIGIGCCVDKDFWEYDPVSDTWAKKSDFGSYTRTGCSSFTIGDSAYVGLGKGVNGYEKDLWKYDVETNTWTQKANFGGTARNYAVGFSIGNKGYVGTGGQLAVSDFNDFWEYDPAVNTWTQKADFSGGIRSAAVGFSIDGKGYIGIGHADDGYKKDFWEYSPDLTEPPCNIPNSLSTTNITFSTAKLQWNPVDGAINYKVKYKVSGTSEWTTIKALENQKTITGLSEYTKYVWKVKSVCSKSPDISSDYSSHDKFTTHLQLVEKIYTPSEIELFSNPTSKIITISFLLNEESQVVIELLNVDGKVLKKTESIKYNPGTNQESVNIQDIPAGVYLILLNTNEGLKTKKMLVVR